MDRHGIIETIFGARRALIGMIHVRALPGTPHGGAPISEIVDIAVDEAHLLAAAGFHGLMLENMHDRPYLRREVGPEVVAAMTAVGRAVREQVQLPVGIQILGGANRAALAVAHACGAHFIRSEGFVFGHVADEGWMDSDAGELLRYRRAIGAQAIRVFTDIKKKHASHAPTADVDIVETARAAQFFLADGVVITGSATGRPTDARDLHAVAAAVEIPTVVGSGVTPEGLSELGAADAWIVGSSLKRDGLWSNPLDPLRAAALVEAYRALPTS